MGNKRTQRRGGKTVPVTKRNESDPEINPTSDRDSSGKRFPRRHLNANAVVAIGTLVLALVAIATYFETRSFYEQDNAAKLSPFSQPEEFGTSSAKVVTLLRNTGKSEAKDIAFRGERLFVPSDVRQFHFFRNDELPRRISPSEVVPAAARPAIALQKEIDAFSAIERAFKRGINTRADAWHQNPQLPDEQLFTDLNRAQQIGDEEYKRFALNLNLPLESRQPDDHEWSKGYHLTGEIAGGLSALLSTRAEVSAEDMQKLSSGEEVLYYLFRYSYTDHFGVRHNPPDTCSQFRPRTGVFESCLK